MAQDGDELRSPEPVAAGCEGVVVSKIASNFSVALLASTTPSNLCFRLFQMCAGAALRARSGAMAQQHGLMEARAARPKYAKNVGRDHVAGVRDLHLLMMSEMILRIGNFTSSENFGFFLDILDF